MPSANSQPRPSGRRGPTRRRVATRERLFAAAQEVFAERGFHGTSVEEICERAGFTRGAFYSNFGSKEDLVLDLAEQHMQQLIGRARALAGRAELSAEQVLGGVLDVWSQRPREEAQWYLISMEFTLHALRDREAGRRWSTLQRRLRTELAEVVERVAAQHGLRLAVSPTEFVRLALALHQGAMAQHLLEPRAVPRRSLERQLLPLVLRPRP
ncbi:MAG TPA: TetR/AcrR family transcriptional regulator [Segeticoccus sp.]|uniref:TetR/AcrR family transcriptional regulator n=1 Tax=Segeticoccus sp. TaxID=2706531 RepID=UPI002D7F020A|nr:TetR/AcrR family transcriptional regulator [Segeticoccus sp.]HET8601459.1 TetR/AcrR family transcriptional regulator [Segeticoccus sp.]